MMKKVLVYVMTGWNNDDAGWCNVLITQMTLFLVFLFVNFLLFGWMFIVY